MNWLNGESIRTNWKHGFKKSSISLKIMGELRPHLSRTEPPNNDESLLGEGLQYLLSSESSIRAIIEIKNYEYVNKMGGHYDPDISRAMGM